MKVVITGGLGFAGINLARELVSLGALTDPSGNKSEIDCIQLLDVAVPDELPGGLDGRVEMVAGDVSDRAVIDGLIDRDDISVFHLASVVSAGGEKDFDLALRINMDGGRNILEALRARGSVPRLVFASSVAIFGGDNMPDVVADTTKATPQTTYGMTKVVGELMINDYTRKGFIDGRTARLPTLLVRPGKPNAAASSFVSGVFREPLSGVECILPVGLDIRMPLLGCLNAVKGMVRLHEVAGGELGTDRAINLPSRSYTVKEMVETMKRVAAANGITPGAVVEETNPDIEAIVRSWATEMNSSRALELGLPLDESLDQVVQEFIDSYL